MTIGVLNIEYDSRCDLESCLVLGSVAKISRADFISNTSAVAEQIANRSHSCIIQNEFAVTCGRVLFDAFDKMEIMENGVKYLLNLKRTDIMPIQIDINKFAT